MTRLRKLAVLGTGLGAFGAALGLLLVGDPARWWASNMYDADPGVALPPLNEGTELRLVPVASGFKQPVALELVPGSAGLAVVLEKGGAARLVDLSRAREATPAVATPHAVLFEVQVRTLSELGLLGIAFHPSYEENGRFFVNYNPSAGAMRTVVSEWQIPPGSVGHAPAKESRVLLEVEQPYANHDGGGLVFGPDGKLFIGLGDGGAANDPHRHGQNLESLLGKMLRIDVDAPPRDGLAYGIPADNPFLAKPGVRQEIWAYGLRNPWRYSFDPHGRLLVADVGQGSFEEIDVVERGDNLGWNVREGAHCLQAETCNTSGLVDPIFEYGRGFGGSVTGGYVIQDSQVPRLAGRYVFGDFSSGHIWSLRVPEGRAPATDVKLHGRWPISISSFGRGPGGELYVLDFLQGTIFRLAPQ